MTPPVGRSRSAASGFSGCCGDTCVGLDDIARKREGLEKAPSPVGRGLIMQKITNVPAQPRT